jgi:hypothetical protein
MVERVLSMHEAKGSMPFFSTFFVVYDFLPLFPVVAVPQPSGPWLTCSSCQLREQAFRIELVAYGSIFLMALFRAGGPYILEEQVCAVWLVQLLLPSRYLQLELRWCFGAMCTVHGALLTTAHVQRRLCPWKSLCIVADHGFG